MRLHDFGTTIMMVLLVFLILDKVDRHFEDERESRVNYVCVEYYDSEGVKIRECETNKG